MLAASAAGAPEHSSTTSPSTRSSPPSGRSPPPCSGVVAARPRRPASSRRRGSGSTTSTRPAPRAAAACAASRPTAPPPKTTTSSPGSSRARRSARTPTESVSASAPASAPTPSGSGMQPLAGALSSAASPPSALKPMEASCSQRLTRWARQLAQRPQLIRPSTATSCPTSPAPPLSPQATTRPATSWPRTIGAWRPVRGCGDPARTNSGPWRYSSVSVPQMPQASTSTCTSPGAGAGGMSMSSTRTSRRPCQRIAFMRPWMGQRARCAPAPLSASRRTLPRAAPSAPVLVPMAARRGIPSPSRHIGRLSCSDRPL